MASWILPKNEHWGIFRYIKLPVFIFWKNSGHHIFFSRFSDLYRAVTFILFLLFIYFTLAILLLARCLRKSDSSIVNDIIEFCDQCVTVTSLKAKNVPRYLDIIIFICTNKYFNRGCLMIIWTGLNIKIGIVQKVYE